MAKPHRMWLLGIALVFAALAAGWAHAILLGAAVVIAAGSALTCVLRLRAIATQLRGPR
jgi:hypothetical protein